VTSHRRLLAAPLSLATLLILAACGGTEAGDDQPAGSGGGRYAKSSAPESSATMSRSAPESTPAADGQVVTVRGSNFGPMLFDDTGQAIYLFDKETSTTAECYGECADAWPPVLTEGEPVADGRARQGLLGTTERRDGTRQVTYDGHPLYYYAHEGKNQVLCHDVREYGGLWLVVEPDGDPAPA
jgi:predicted lipoprotein with Yx(FWY)xxD motif